MIPIKMLETIRKLIPLTQRHHSIDAWPKIKVTKSFKMDASSAHPVLDVVKVNQLSSQTFSVIPKPSVLF